MFVKVMVPPKTRQLNAVDQSQNIYVTNEKQIIYTEKMRISLNKNLKHSTSLNEDCTLHWASSKPHHGLLCIKFINISEQGVSLTHTYRQTFLEAIDTSQSYRGCNFIPVCYKSTESFPKERPSCPVVSKQQGKQEKRKEFQRLNWNNLQDNFAMTIFRTSQNWGLTWELKHEQAWQIHVQSSDVYIWSGIKSRKAFGININFCNERYLYLKLFLFKSSINKLQI